MGNLFPEGLQTELKGTPLRQTCIVPPLKLSATRFQTIFWQNKPLLRFAISYISNFNILKNFILFQKSKFLLENLRKDHNMMKIKTFSFFYKKEYSQVKNREQTKKIKNKTIKSLITFN